MLVVQSNNEGVPFVLAEPERAQISQDVARVASELLAVHGLGVRPVAAQALTAR